ncbi:hypothetical protein LWI28_011242 [Acer negundo]|uniref:Uncharacterized protein n=1 Tax=Acer negundo TaxID=4023 RepID=A0AAD5IR83_ACENE|nr:hypothetical protein LWI28_011242 [Acer negundo]KAK4843117.1 hypothetical protein QYF36_004170 [Acer negundo]
MNTSAVDRLKIVHNMTANGTKATPYFYYQGVLRVFHTINPGQALKIVKKRYCMDVEVPQDDPDVVPIV